MIANKAIILSAVIYTVLFITAVFLYYNMNFSGSDAAGRGMERGFILLYGLGGAFLIAIILALVNRVQFKETSLLWVRLIYFVPLLLPMMAAGITYFEIGVPKAMSMDVQELRLTFEIRSSKKLDAPRLMFKSSSGSSSGILSYVGDRDGFHFYEKSNAISSAYDRFFYVEWAGIKTQKHVLKIPYQPQVTSFSNWQDFFEIDNGSEEAQKLEFRYKIDNPENL
ncbi:hypothetical protein [Flagellimonas meishanensis]|uniref:hypothetical protein n=1 Tax=Flagellimonas meishanensis TaxID=2873264 RepID=UPI001CA62E58|nr:hypothetical protein [[Muricauda] meishanensis]